MRFSRTDAQPPAAPAQEHATQQPVLDVLVDSQQEELKLSLHGRVQAIGRLDTKRDLNQADERTKRCHCSAPWGLGQQLSGSAAPYKAFWFCLKLRRSAVRALWNLANQSDAI